MALDAAAELIDYRVQRAVTNMSEGAVVLRARFPFA